MDFTDYMLTYFKGCALVGKKPWLPHVAGGLGAKPIYVFRLPRGCRDRLGRRMYGAIDPDHATCIWQYEWYADAKLSKCTDEDRETVKHIQKVLCEKHRPPRVRLKPKVKKVRLRRG